MAAATLRPHSSYMEASDRSELCETVQGPSGVVKCRLGGRIWCHTRVQGFCSVPFWEVEGCFERETGQKRGKSGQGCEHFEVRAGSTRSSAIPFWEVAQNGVVGAGGGHIGATWERAVGGTGEGGVGRGESPLQDAGVRDVVGGGVRLQAAGWDREQRRTVRDVSHRGRGVEDRSTWCVRGVCGRPRACAQSPLTGRGTRQAVRGALPVYRETHGMASCRSVESVAEIGADGAARNIAASNMIPGLLPPLTVKWTPSSGQR